MVNGSCLLCNQNKKLVKGHIFPNFIKKWVISDIYEYMESDLCLPEHKNKTIKYFYKKKFSEKDRKKQDLEKMYLFCNECDNEKLSRIEDLFKRIYFDEIIKWETKISSANSDILLIKKFCTSIAFRVLYSIGILEEDSLNSIDKKTHHHATKAAEEWRSIITEEKTHSDSYDLYFAYLTPFVGDYSSRTWSFIHALYPSNTNEKNFLLVLCGPLIVIGKLNPEKNVKLANVHDLVEVLIEMNSKEVKLVGDNEIEANILTQFIKK